jgi:hypothetical protein
MMKVTVGEHGHYFGAGTNVFRAKEAAGKIALKMIREEEAFTKDRSGATELMLML